MAHTCLWKMDLDSNKVSDLILIVMKNALIWWNFFEIFVIAVFEVIDAKGSSRWNFESLTKIKDCGNVRQPSVGQKIIKGQLISKAIALVFRIWEAMKNCFWD